MRWFVGCVALCLAAVAAGLVVDGLGVSIGGWLVLAALAVLVVVFASLSIPDPGDIVIALLVFLVSLPGLLALDALDAPRWSGWLLIGIVAAGWIALRERREGPPSGRIRIPPGYRFGTRKRR